MMSGGVFGTFVELRICWHTKLEKEVAVITESNIQLFLVAYLDSSLGSLYR